MASSDSDYAALLERLSSLPLNGHLDTLSLRLTNTGAQAPARALPSADADESLPRAWTERSNQKEPKEEDEMPSSSPLSSMGAPVTALPDPLRSLDRALWDDDHSDDGEREGNDLHSQSPSLATLSASTHDAWLNRATYRASRYASGEKHENHHQHQHHQQHQDRDQHQNRDRDRDQRPSQQFQQRSQEHDFARPWRVRFEDAAAATAARASALAASAALELSPISSAVPSPGRPANGVRHVNSLYDAEGDGLGVATDEQSLDKHSGASPDMIPGAAASSASVARAQLLYRAQRRRTQELETQLEAQEVAYTEDRSAMLHELEQRTRLHQEAVDELEKVASALQRCRGELHAARAAQTQLQSELHDQGHALALSEADATAATAMVTQLQVRVAELERQPQQAARHALEEQVAAVRRQHEAASDALRQRLAAAEAHAAQCEDRLRLWQQQQQQQQQQQLQNQKGQSDGSAIAAEGNNESEELQVCQLDRRHRGRSANASV